MVRPSRCKRVITRRSDADSLLEEHLHQLARRQALGRGQVRLACRERAHDLFLLFAQVGPAQFRPGALPVEFVDAGVGGRCGTPGARAARRRSLIPSFANTFTKTLCTRSSSLARRGQMRPDNLEHQGRKPLHQLHASVFIALPHSLDAALRIPLCFV